MKYLKTLALLISFSTLASCTEGFEDFPADVYSINDTQDTKSVEPTDTTTSRQISIHFDEPEVEEINYAIIIP